jgi:transcriptional regulator with XRE-family HTH domain
VNREIGDFLRSRRARVQPDDLGLSSYGRRRVPGLRREELAQAAGVSVDYYVRLEQGRTPNVSDSVLDAIANALRLDATERAHLRDLVRPAKPARTAPRPQRVHPGLVRLLETIEGVPAFVLGRRMDILAWNRLADAICGFSAMRLAQRNAARYTFLDPAAHELYADWPAVAAETVAYLRLDAGRHPNDPSLASLVGELSMQDDTFRQLWARHGVQDKTRGVKRMNHPVVGELNLNYETLALPDDPTQLLVTYLAAADDPDTADRLRLLASWDDQTAGSGSTTVSAKRES